MGEEVEVVVILGRALREAKERGMVKIAQTLNRLKG